MVAAHTAVQRGPEVNLSDIPELMPGAQPSANPARRGQFEQCCIRLHADEVEEHTNELWHSRTAAGVGVTYKELEEMFPSLDTALIHTLLAEAPSPKHAIETLLALSASAAEPVTDAGEAPAAPPRNLPRWDLGVEDHNKFPSLVDADGWQIPSRLPQADEENLGDAWRDRARAAADKPAPKRTPQPAVVPQRRRQGRRRTTSKSQPCLSRSMSSAIERVSAEPSTGSSMAAAAAVACQVSGLAQQAPSRGPRGRLRRMSST
jgi:hypothetical protein